MYDLGNELLFKKSDKEQCVQLGDIIKIDNAYLSSRKRIVINMRTEGPLGKSLAFNPPMCYFSFSRNPLPQELIDRVDCARNA